MKYILTTAVLVALLAFTIKADPDSDKTKTVRVTVTHSGQELVPAQAGKILIPTMVALAYHGEGKTSYTCSDIEILYGNGRPFGALRLPNNIVSQTSDVFGCFYVDEIQDGSRFVNASDVVDQPLVFSSDMAGGNGKIEVTVTYEAIKY